jgi:crotonobetainyl-CoA:carnitine CoA-transferase CaiB-like acyl-CoA transferase
VLGRDDWGGLSLTNRAARADAIEAAIAAWAAPRSAEDAAELLQAAGVSAGRVQPMDSLCYDPQLSGAGFWQEMERRYVGFHLMPNAPWTYDGARLALRNPAPTFGEHTDEVLAELAAETA